MHISFFPTLGSHARVPVGSPITSTSRDADGVQAAFTARLSPQDYAEAVKSGLRIEVWTNAPSGARPAGAWGPIAFEEVDVSEDAQAVIKPEVRLSSSGAMDNEDCPSASHVRKLETHEFRAALTLPRESGTVFEFTYRLVYPGGICWLGSDRDNGVLQLDANSSFFEENGTWTNQGKRRLFSHELESQDGAEYTMSKTDSVCVGALDMFEWMWSGWATDGSRVWSFSSNRLEDVQDARLALLFPTPSRDSLVVPQVQVFHSTSENALFSITRQGQLVLYPCRQGSGISYWPCDYNSRDDFNSLRHEILALCPAPYVFPIKASDIIIFTTNHDIDASVTIHVQPLTRLRTPHCASFPVKSLEPLVKYSTTLALLNPETRSTLFVDCTDGSADITLTFGASGTQVVVSAVYALTDNAEQVPEWLVSLPEYTVIPERIPGTNILENPLPTPPASPQTKPHRTVSFVLPIETEGEHELRRRKTADYPVSQRSGAARRLVRSESAFERFQAASGGEKIRVLIMNVLKLLVRFMGIAILRCIQSVLRLVGAGGHPNGRLRISRDEHSDTSSEIQDNAYASKKTDDDNTSAITSEGGEHSTSSVEKDVVEVTPSQDWSAVSTDANGKDLDCGLQHDDSIGRTTVRRNASPALKWNLPGQDVTPIRLLVHSGVESEDISKHLCIELNGKDVVTEGWGAVHGAGTNTSVIEIERPRDVPEMSTLLVRLRG